MDASFLPFPRAIWGGVITFNVFAVLASAALCSVFLRIAWLAGVAFKTKQSPPEFVFFRTQLGFYAASLLFANFVVAGSGLANVYWLTLRGINPDRVCTIQAIVMQIGSVAGAYFTVAIALHTFITLVLQVGQSAIVGIVFILLGWITATVVAIMPHYRSHVYGPAGITCAVRPEFNRSKFLLHLLPIFIAALSSALLAALIFLILRGTLVVKGGIRLTLDPERRPSRSNPLEGGSYETFMLSVAKAVLWIPLAYVTFLGPYSVTQMLMLADFHVAFQVEIFASVCWFVIGIVNVLLFYNIFRVLVPVIAVRSRTTSGMLEKGPYTPSFISAGFAEKQQHRRQPSETNSIMSTTSSRPLVRYYSPSNDTWRTDEHNFGDVSQVPSSYYSPQHSRRSSFDSTRSRNGVQGPAQPQYTTPTRVANIHAGAFKSAHDRVLPHDKTVTVSKPVKTSVPQDLDSDSPAADHYPRASYFETYYGAGYVASIRPPSQSPKLRPLLLQGGLRETN